MRYLLFSLMLLAAPLRADWIADSDAITLRVIEQQATLNPEMASSYGLAQFDAGTRDLGPGIAERFIVSNRSLIQQLEGELKRAELPRVRQDIQVIITALQNEIDTVNVERQHLLPYYNVHQYLYQSFNRLLDPRNDPARYAAALERLAGYTGRAEGHKPLTASARARTEEQLDNDALLGPYIKELQADLDNAPRYVAGIRSLFERAGLSGWEDDMVAMESQLVDYTAWVKARVLPRARQDNQMPLPVYINRLRNYGVNATPEQLIPAAQYSYQLLRSEMKALAWRIAEQRGWEDKRLVPVMRKLKAEQIPDDQVLAVYQARLADVEAIIRREKLISLPERDAVIRLATEAESAAIPAPFMSPPQMINNTGQHGEFVLVKSNPQLGGEAAMDDWTHQSVTWALTVHEARPGHELQFARLVEDGTSLARAIYASNSANTEGWGLYAESIMQEFLPLEGQLFNLFTRIMRAARMFLDPMVNTGQLTHEEVVSFLMDEIALSLPMASSEADRYTFRAPGQATSYYYGYTNLMRLRTEVEIAQGEAFDQKAFHDFILAQGLLPPELLREAVLGEFVR